MGEHGGGGEGDADAAPEVGEVTRVGLAERRRGHSK